MSLVLVPVFWALGFITALLGGSAIGFLLVCGIACSELFRSKHARTAIVIYTVCMITTGSSTLLILWLVGIVRESAHYTSPSGFIAGAIFPGIFALAIPHQFVQVARRQLKTGFDLASQTPVVP